MQIVDINQAAAFLGTNTETVRQLAIDGQILGLKAEKGWRFLTYDLVFYLRSHDAKNLNSKDRLQ